MGSDVIDFGSKMVKIDILYLRQRLARTRGGKCFFTVLVSTKMVLVEIAKLITRKLLRIRARKCIQTTH